MTGQTAGARSRPTCALSSASLNPRVTSPAAVPDTLAGLAAYQAVALVDVGDGPQGLKAIRAEAPQLPCCAMSAIFGGSDEADLRALGAAAILPKPFRLENCLHILRAIALVKK